MNNSAFFIIVVYYEIPGQAGNDEKEWPGMTKRVAGNDEKEWPGLPAILFLMYHN